MIIIISERHAGLVIDERRAATGVELEHVEEVLQLAACPLFDASRQNCVCLPLDVCFCITLEVKGSGS